MEALGNYLHAEGEKFGMTAQIRTALR